jgi:D-alanyl-D-alanine dipeptidase
MRTRLVLLLFPILAGCALFRGEPPLAATRQAVVVTSADWDATTATMQRSERASGGGRWQAVGEAVPVVLGRTGLAWGRGVHPERKDGPRKREGDGKSPAGIFRLGTAFGFEPAAATGLPYIALKETTECVDDPSSPHYNRIVDAAAVEKVDWTSSEKMRGIAVYRQGLVILHNVPPARKGGSCVFMHLRSPQSKPTAGCTAMDDEAMTTLLRWLDAEAQPMLVQLPAEEYAMLRTEWELP